ncbi:MAG: HD domain-containing protein [Mariprofundaceae bacterium]|nr:HD domain-containing protein [Mariprofundaceae bacterium]
MLDILVLEDQPAVREVMTEIVQDLGVEIYVGQASSLSEARAMLAKQPWQGLVTDLSLGDGQSLALIEELREAGNDMPVILVSGFLSAERLQQAGRLNVAHVLAKPFDPEVLLDCMRTFLTVDNMDDVPIPKIQKHDNHRLLPEMFEMDRRLGLLYRMFDEIPKKRDVSGVCQATLSLALEMVHAERGFLALFERKQESLVIVANKGMNDIALTMQCALGETPFRPLIYAEEEYLEVLSSAGASQPCWPGVNDDAYVAIPVSLQGIHMGVLCLMQRKSNEPLKSEERHLLGLLMKELDTLLDNRAVHAALADSMNQTLIGLVRSLEARDRYTKDHSMRVGHLSMVFAQELGLDEETIQIIRTGGRLHDIGKVGVADAVLLKPGRYTEQEFAKMKAHPAIGDSILKNMDSLVRERLMVRHHHERMDGRGYPDSLAGEDIPFEARIVCVADAIDAMTTHRVYRMAKPLSFCLEQLRNNSGIQFDPQVVEVAVSVIENGLVHTQADPTPKNTEGLMPLSASDMMEGVLHA